MDATTPPQLRELDAVRRRRAEMGETLAQLRRAIDGRPDELGAALDRLATDFALHVEVTEGPGGLHQAIIAGDLRLANQVAALAAEHATIGADVAAANAAPDQRAAADLLARMVKHRERGAELIYEAYQTDLGGGD